MLGVAHHAPLRYHTMASWRTSASDFGIGAYHILQCRRYPMAVETATDLMVFTLGYGSNLLSGVYLSLAS